MNNDEKNLLATLRTADLRDAISRLKQLIRGFKKESQFLSFFSYRGALALVAQDVGVQAWITLGPVTEEMAGDYQQRTILFDALWTLVRDLPNTDLTLEFSSAPDGIRIQAGTASGTIKAGSPWSYAGDRPALTEGRMVQIISDPFLEALERVLPFAQGHADPLRRIHLRDDDIFLLSATDGYRLSVAYPGEGTTPEFLRGISLPINAVSLLCKTTPKKGDLAAYVTVQRCGDVLWISYRDLRLRVALDLVPYPDITKVISKPTWNVCISRKELLTVARQAAKLKKKGMLAFYFTPDQETVRIYSAGTTSVAAELPILGRVKRPPKTCRIAFMAQYLADLCAFFRGEELWLGFTGEMGALRVFETVSADEHVLMPCREER